MRTIKLSTNCETRVEPVALSHIFFSPVIFLILWKTMTSSSWPIKKAGAVVLGVSKDGKASHQKFIEKYGLPFALLSDEEVTVCTAYGVYKEKSMYGRKYMGIERSTFVIDATGRIKALFRKVKVPGHVDEVLAALKA